MPTRPAPSVLYYAALGDGLALSYGTRPATCQATCWYDDEGSNKGPHFVEEGRGGRTSAYDDRALGRGFGQVSGGAARGWSRRGS
jgi:hypothetical protein